MATEPQKVPDSVRRWAIFRVVLGNAQMFGATVAVILLLTQGVTTLTLIATGVTVAAMVLSIAVFRGPWGGSKA